MSETPHYYAFISYSHVNIDKVENIHQRLENYRIPRCIRKQKENLPFRLCPIFLDKQDLSLGPMTKNLEIALKNSDYLIIFCSEASRTSKWVKKEIKFFSKSRKCAKNYIIPIVIKENAGDSSGIELFPDSLSKELLYIDIDNIDNEWLRIIAKLLDVCYTKISRLRQKSLWIKNMLIVFFILCIMGLGYWGYSYWGKIHYRYYTDYTDCRGIPKGIRELNSKERSHRNNYYRFASKHRKLREVSYINSHGKIIDHSDTEYRDRVAHLLLFYNHEKINEIHYQDAVGNLLKKCTIQDDSCNYYDFWASNGKVDGMAASQTNIDWNLFSTFQNKERALIRRYILTRDKDGYISELYFAQNNNSERITDAEGIGGFKYQRNGQGQIAVIYYLNLKGEPQDDRTGIAGRRYSYDPSSGRVDRVEYFGLDGSPILNKAGWSCVASKIDKNGNVTEERFMDSYGNLCINNQGFAIQRMDYDEEGNCTKLAIYDTNENLCMGSNGFAIERIIYDKKGNKIWTHLFDTLDAPCYNLENVVSFFRKYDNNNRVIEEKYYDINRKLLFNKYGYACKKWDYDNQNRLIRISYYDTSLQLCFINKGYAEIEREYDSKSRLKSEKYLAPNKTLCYNNEGIAEIRWQYETYGNVEDIAFFDIQGIPCYYKSGIARIHRDYNLQGRILKLAFYGTDSLLCLSNEGVAGFTQTFNKYGLVANRKLFGTDERPCYSSFGVAQLQWEYNGSGFITKELYCDTTGHMCFNKENIAGWTGIYDNQNNLVERTYLDTLKNPHPNELDIVTLLYEYNRQRQEVRITFLDEKRNLCYSNQGLAGYTCQYDVVGHLIRKACFDIEGKPCLNYMGLAGHTITYDEHHRQIAEAYFDVQNKSCIIEDGFTKQTWTYDERGRCIENAYWGTDMNLCLNKNGYAFQKTEYDELNHEIANWFFGTDSLLCLIKDDSVAGIEYKFDEKNKIIEMRNKGVDSSLCMSKDQFAKLNVKYNKYGRIIEWAYYDTLENLCMNKEKVTIIRYSCDERGYPIKEEYLGIDSIPVLNIRGIAGIHNTLDHCGRSIEKTFFDTTGQLIASNEGIMKRLCTYETEDRIQFCSDIHANGDTMVIVPILIVQRYMSSTVADTFFIMKTDSWKFGDYYAYFNVKNTKTYKIWLLDKYENLALRSFSFKKGGNGRSATLKIPITLYRKLKKSYQINNVYDSELTNLAYFDRKPI